ncbi:hypothetical protein BsWGS_06866 [Bradybaena similaris]
MSTLAGGAFGAGKAGAPFDPVQCIKKPQVIFRALSVLFAIIVFGCISSDEVSREPTNEDSCIMNDDGNACGYGIGIGVLAFLICLGFLVVDAFFENLSSVQHRKYAVLADLGFSALWTFLWFVGFCYMTDAWRRGEQHFPGRSRVQAAIAFSFFSIFSWGGLAFLALRRYRLGSQETFDYGYEHDPNASSPYRSFPGSDIGDPYHQPPFSQQRETPDYPQPTY